MSGLHELGGLTVDPRAWADEVGGVELVAAGVALVPAGAVGSADRAGALDVAVGEGAPGGGGDRRAGHLLDHVAVVPHGGEHVLDHVVVVSGGGAGEQVVGQAQGHEVLDDEPVVAVGELTGTEALLVGGDEDRGAVLIGARDHEDVMTGHAHVAREDVRGNTEAGDVADVTRAVGVRPGDCGQDVGHGGQPIGFPTDSVHGTDLVHRLRGTTSSR